MPVQSDRMYSMVSWRDLKEPSDYLYEKYCKRQGRRMYLYGVSLGGIIQTHYILEDNANTPYSGVVSYGVPFKPDESLHAFKSNGFGFYDWFLGLFINLWARTLIDDLAKFASKEKIEIYRHGLFNESFRLKIEI